MCNKANKLKLKLSEAKYKTKYRERLEILTSKQMLQRLPITLARLKAGNTYESLLHEIREIIYFLYWAKVCKHVCNIIMNSIEG